ncbi:MAG TPA: DUF1800 domain-containing protein [Burkholderiaceae bacterium]|nr:DUF1800 domain-containing protein [Burkholderiaceae bacterium]
MNVLPAFKVRSLLAAAAAALTLSACGGGGGEAAAPVPAPATAVPPLVIPEPPAGGFAPSGPTAAPAAPSDAQAVRFLAQSTFGATSAEIDRLKRLGYNDWIEQQFQIPRSSHLDFVLGVYPIPTPEGVTVTIDPLYQSFWRQAITAPDPLRQRVTYALSQILVTSAADAALQTAPHTLASYLDTLSIHAFGSYRDLLEAVSKHPAMGQYLTSLANRGDGGRVPDENYAREVMQLFSIGLVQLNIDGTPKLVNGEPVDTYSMDDIRGLARVFTGWGWGNTGTPDPVNGRFGGNNPQDPMRRVIPMQFYAQYHSPLEKQFLGITVPAGTAGPQALKTALDALFSHPNVGPFIATRLIQHMVISNPSPAYVGRVAAVFNDNGKGVRGDLKATVRAVLFDPEAVTPVAGPSEGKLREPTLRLAAWIRAFGATSASGNFRIGVLDNQLSQTPMRAPSVFNYFRPGFVPPNTSLATAELVAPEFQITHEISVAAYANFMQGVIQNGVGTGSDVRADYTSTYALADNADALVARINLMLAANSLSTATVTSIRDAVNAIPMTAGNARQNRTQLAIYLTMTSPEFLVQK